MTKKAHAKRIPYGKQEFRKSIRAYARANGFTYTEALRRWKDHRIHLRNQMADVTENYRKYVNSHPSLKARLARTGDLP